VKKSYPETDESGQFMRSTMLDMDSRLRVARAVEKDETQASMEVFRLLKRRGHPDSPPATISDGWGGIDEAMVEVYGMVLSTTIRFSHQRQLEMPMAEDI
jgi:hypothetical protein